jgi:hypothetical protein
MYNYRKILLLKLLCLIPTRKDLSSLQAAMAMRAVATAPMPKATKKKVKTITLQDYPEVGFVLRSGLNVRV